MRRKIYALCVAGLVFCSGCGAAKDGKESVPEGAVEEENVTSEELAESEEEAGSTEGIEQAEEIGEQEETEQAQVAANTSTQTSAGYEAYRKLLQEQLDYMIAHPEEYDMDAAMMEFALLDVDRDGREELLIAKAPYVMAGMSAEIYDYNPDVAELYLEFSGFPAFTIYDNGVICEDASHNQGKGEKLWPYSLHKYDAAQDVYSCMAYIDSWDKELVPDGFPEAVDADGDGTVYYINEGEWTNEKAVDNAVYEEWLASYMAGAEEVAVTWTKLTEENIANLIPSGEKSYFGTWRIKECAGTSQFYAMSDEEIQRVIGSEFTYSADSFSNTWENVTVAVDGYEEVDYPAESFAVDYKVPAEKLGITSETVVFVSAMTNDVNCGDYFVVVDENTILIQWDGVFFRAEK